MIPPLQRSTADDAAATSLAWASWPADVATPVALFRALRATGHTACLLESVEGPARLTRYSFVGVDPVAHFRAGPTGASLKTTEGTQDYPPGARAALREASATVLGAPVHAPPGLPPFCGGWVGFFAYEWATELEPRVPRAQDVAWDTDDVVLDLYRDVLAVDHAAQRITVLTACDDGAAGHTAATRRVDDLAADAFAVVEDPAPFDVSDDWTASLPDHAYEDGVATLRHDISQGEIFQGVLSRRFERTYTGDPFTLYRALRLSNPSPHMFFFEADGITLVGSSPERLVAVTDGRAEVRPIAGTRPRGATPDEDDRLAAELRADTKERAEHDMLVDLARNDLGRVARIGSVRVSEYAALERFARVQHLVSRVVADLAAGQDALDALSACFPAGTVSGAPKVRAMELLAELEPQTRGPYGGCFGYLDLAGNIDMALVIRTFVLAGERLSVQAGAGVVFDSVPERESQETRDKAQALFDAVLDACAPTWSGDAHRPPTHTPTGPVVPTREAAR